MVFAKKSWEELVDIPICPVEVLEQTLVDMEITLEDIDKIEGFIGDLKEHEEELRELRQEIERRVRLLKIDLNKKEI